MRSDYIVVGAGFAGSVIAERLAAAGKSVLIIDRRTHVGGNAHDYTDDAGILVHKYGPHIFHTNSRRVWEYLSMFTAWRPYEHRVRADVGGGRLVPVPINRETLDRFGGSDAAARAAIVIPYTRKQWGCDPEDLDPAVLARIRTRDSYDDRYFTDTYQAMPVDGFTAIIRRMLSSDLITVSLGSASSPNQVWCRELKRPVIYTGMIDEFFGWQFGRLPYRSARFKFSTMAAEDWSQGVAVVNYPSPDVEYTRITEFKQLTGQQHPLTTIAFEYPKAYGDPLWPVPKVENQSLYQKYRALAKLTPDVHFLGRLGTYAYLNIDQVVGQALALAEKLVGNGFGGVKG